MKDSENNINDIINKLDIKIAELEKFNIKSDSDVYIDIKINNDILKFKKENNKCGYFYINNGKEDYKKLSLDEFNKFLDEFMLITSSWTNTDLKGNKPEYKITIKANEYKREISGNNNHPYGWNKFINLISNYKDMSLEDLIKEKINDLETQKNIIDYFRNEINESDEVLISLFKSVSKYEDIFNEFILSVINKTYDFENPVIINGYSAKKLVSLKHDFKTTGVYIFLNLLRENPSLAREIIENDFNKEKINNNEYFLKVVRTQTKTIDGNKETKKPIITYHDPKIKLITINSINIVINEINDYNIKFTLIYDEVNEEVDLKINESYKLQNINEDITITLINKNDLNNI